MEQKTSINLGLPLRHITTKQPVEFVGMVKPANWSGQEHHMLYLLRYRNQLHTVDYLGLINTVVNIPEPVLLPEQDISGYIIGVVNPSGSYGLGLWRHRSGVPGKDWNWADQRAQLLCKEFPNKQVTILKATKELTYQVGRNNV